MKLFHATSAHNIESIRSSGLFSLSCLTNSDDMSDYYCETITDDGDTPVVLEIDITDLIKSIGEEHITPDYASIEEPISSCLDIKEDEVADAWAGSLGTWRDSLQIVKSVRCTAPIPAHVISFVNVEPSAVMAP